MQFVANFGKNNHIRTTKLFTQLLKQNNSILQLLNVRREEAPLVKRLFAFEFMQGAGIAFFFTSAFTLFLHRFSINELPKVFIIAAFLLWATGFVYSQLEHRLSPSALGKVITLTMIVSILGLRLGLFFTDADWYLYLMLAWFNALYLLNSLQFWGMAAVLFDLRQSKRLFSVISAGDIPAKFIGYSLASLVVYYISSDNMLWASLLCMVGSLPILAWIDKAALSEVHIEHAHPDSHAAPTGDLRQLVKKFTGHPLIAKIATLSFLFSLCLYIINFALYAEVKAAYHDDVQMAKFITLFLAATRLVALLIKTIFTSRLLANLGYKTALLITPVFLGIFILGVFVEQFIVHDERVVFYVFGMMAVTADVLRSALHAPIFLTLMQPLPTADRLRAHNVVKGIMDPFAYLVTGLLLLALIQAQDHAELITLCFILLGLLACCVVGIVRVHGQYLQTVAESIQTRFFGAETVEIADKDSLQLIAKKLEDGSETEKIYLLQLLNQQEPTAEIEALTLEKIGDISPTVQLEALRLAAQQPTWNSKPQLLAIIQKQTDPTLTAQALRMIGTESVVLSFITHPNPIIQQAAITGILENKTAPSKSEAKTKLKELAESNSVQQRQTAAAILGDLGNATQQDTLIALLQDDNDLVVETAIEAAGKTQNQKIWAVLLTLFPKHETWVLAAFEQVGQAAVPLLKDYLLANNSTEKQKLGLLRLCGRIGGARAFGTLLEMMNKLPQQTQEIVRILHRSGFRAGESHRVSIEGWAKHHLSFAQTLAQMQQQLDSNQENQQLLHKALQTEQLDVRTTLLHLFSFVYDAANLRKIQKGLEANRKETVANALELTELTLPKNYATPFIALFEKGTPLPENGQTAALSTILNHPTFAFHAWTQTCYRAMTTPTTNDLLLIEKVLILKSLAIFQQTPENILAEVAPLMQQVELEQNALIFNEGEAGDCMYVIYRGTVRIHKGNNTLAALKEREVFGELSLLDTETRSASATAQTDCFLFKIDQEPFYDLMEARPEVMRGIMGVLSKRLRLQNERAR